MTEVVQNSNVVEVTNQPGFLENLETLQQRLSVCEKALAEYLETKRLTFPRFYFVSASDLLEIVSKGTQPKQVTDSNLIMFSNKKTFEGIVSTLKLSEQYILHCVLALWSGKCER